MEIPTRRRRALSTVLALFLAIESVSAVAAVAVTPRGAVGAETAPAAVPARVVRMAATAVAPAALTPAASRTMAPSVRRTVDAPDAARSGPARTTAPAIRARTLSPKAVLAMSKPKSKTSSGAATSGGSATVKAGALKGRNHFWFPAVGINRSVYSFPCSRSRAPDNLVYRWGCAGRNNVYLMGHAHSVFSPLHNAYVNGRLKVGMKAYYADSRGKVHTYKVKWWKLTKPTTSASWAWASQSVPSMTLQTCVGSNSQYRLMVRLVEVR